MAELDAEEEQPPLDAAEEEPMLQTPVQGRPRNTAPFLSPITEESPSAAAVNSNSQEGAEGMCMPVENSAFAPEDGMDNSSWFGRADAGLHQVLVAEMRSLSDRLARLEHEVRSPARGCLESQIATILEAGRRDAEQRRELATVFAKALEEEREGRIMETTELRASVQELSQAAKAASLEVPRQVATENEQSVAEASKVRLDAIKRLCDQLAEELAEQHTRAALDLVDRHMEAAKALDARSAELLEITESFRREAAHLRHEIREESQGAASAKEWLRAGPQRSLVTQMPVELAEYAKADGSAGHGLAFASAAPCMVLPGGLPPFAAQKEASFMPEPSPVPGLMQQSRRPLVRPEGLQPAG